MMYLLIFIIDFLVAFFWSECVKAVVRERPFPAAMWSVALTLAGAVTILAYTSNPAMIIPAVLGSGIGTYLSVKYKKHDNQDQV